MDIERMSMCMNKSSLKGVVTIYLMKIQMNTNSEMAVGMKEMMDNTEAEISK